MIMMMTILFVMILVSIVKVGLRLAWNATKFVFGLGLFCFCPLLFVLVVLQLGIACEACHSQEGYAEDSVCHMLSFLVSWMQSYAFFHEARIKAAIFFAERGILRNFGLGNLILSLI